MTDVLDQFATWEAELHQDLALPGSLSYALAEEDDACDPDDSGVSAGAADSLLQVLQDVLGEEDPLSNQHVCRGAGLVGGVGVTWFALRLHSPWFASAGHIRQPAWLA